MADTMLVPMLGVHNCAAALEFYAAAFGAVELGERIEFEGKIGHAEFEILGNRVMIADEFPAHNTSPRTLSGTPVILNLSVDNVDAWTQRAVQAGATLIREPAYQPYGRTSKFSDPFGHVWLLHQDLPG